MTNMIVSFTLRPLDQAEPGVSGWRCPGDEHGRQLQAPDLDQAEHDRQLQPAAGDEPRRGNRRRAGRQPVALVTSMIVSFTLRTSTRPSTGVSFSGRPPVTSIDVGIDGGPGRQPVAPW